MWFAVMLLFGVCCCALLQVMGCVGVVVVRCRAIMFVVVCSYGDVCCVSSFRCVCLLSRLLSSGCVVCGVVLFGF